MTYNVNQNAQFATSLIKRFNFVNTQSSPTRSRPVLTLFSVLQSLEKA